MLSLYSTLHVALSYGSSKDTDSATGPVGAPDSISHLLGGELGGVGKGVVVGCMAKE
jgi:hypothetical protein